MGSTTNPISIGTLNVEEGSGYVATFVQSFAQPEATINRALRDGDSSVVTAVAPGLHTYFLAVSYTHLTLPTIYPVLISWVAVSLKKNH